MDLQKLFEKVKIQPQLRSIAGVFFNEDRIDSTDYKPSYQRNYVWDADKASYFIESIFIGTDVPPLIYFQNDGKNEIIDGRQRYETILNFVQGKLKLRKSGMPKLGGLKDFVGKSFNDLKEEHQELFKKTKLRIIEFSFLRESHTPEEEEMLKHEIFQRYNTGITPLKTTDVEKAEYSEDSLIGEFKNRLSVDENYELFQTLFSFVKPSIEVFQHEIIDLMVMNIVPVKFYARQPKNVLKRHFEHLSNDADSYDNVKEIVDDFFKKLKVIDKIRAVFEREGIQYNRRYSECLFWALSIFSDEYQEFDPSDDDCSKMAEYFKEFSEKYQMLRSSFAKATYDRYECTAQYFERLYPSIDFDIKLDIDERFRAKNNLITAENKQNLVEFKNLHIHKQDAITSDVSDICSTLNSSSYILRPSYQRKEVITVKKASQIIESLLLDIKLPPIFVYYRKDKISEVVDGQQRLLSILAFTKKPYMNEKGEEEHSKIEGFRLNLKDSILKKYHGMTFDELPIAEQRALMNAGIWIAEISEESNPDFEAIDLFVRLNNKPYPIKPHTFEMWNSYINRYIIDTIKCIVLRYKSWFYLRKTSNARMENENLLIILAYFEYQKKHSPQNSWIEDGLYPDKTMDIFLAGEKVNCRLKSKVEVTRFLQEHVEEATDAINLLEFGFITNLHRLLDIRNRKHEDSTFAKLLDELMCIDNGKRTIQGFYILWLLCNELTYKVIEERADELFDRIRDVFKFMRSTDSVSCFFGKISAFNQDFIYHSDKEETIWLTADKVLDLNSDEKTDSDFYLAKKFLLGSTRFFTVSEPSDETIKVSVTRKPFKAGYIKAILSSRLFFFKRYSKKLDEMLALHHINEFKIPYASESVQDVFEKLIALIDETPANSANILYFWDILDLAVLELYYSNICRKNDVEVISLLQKYFEHPTSSSELYLCWSQPNSKFRLYTYRAKDMLFEIFNEIQEL